MAKGSRYWADSYIVLNNGKKIYLEEDITDIEKQMRDESKKRITVEVSSWFGDETMSIKKKDIAYWGSV